MAGPEFPDENWASTVSRAAIESIAWVGGPWAAGELVGLWAVPVTALLVIGVPWLVRRALPLGKESTRLRASVPGMIRVIMFFDLCTIAVWAMWYLFGPGAGLITIGFAVAAHAFGWERIRWLLAGAPAA
jgi:hypothetical protein